MHSAVQIADYFIELSLKKTGRGIFLSPLVKLPYIAHGYTLALTEKPLCCESVEVWQYGPVFSSIYYAFKDQPSPKEIPESEGGQPIFTKYEKRIMEHTFKIYGDLGRIKLSALTHQEGTPWFKAKKEGRQTIEDKNIKEYYENLLDKTTLKEC